MSRSRLLTRLSLHGRRRGHHARLPRALRDRIPEHRLYLVHLARPQRADHGRAGDHDLVRPTRPVTRARLVDSRTDRHTYMVISEVVTLVMYVISMAFLPEYFGTCLVRLPRQAHASLAFALPDLEFVVSTRFAWKVAVIVAISTLPLYIIKLIRSRIAPAVSSKLL